MQTALTENNFLTFAMNHYDNPQCVSLDEFSEDITRFMALKKLFFRFYRRGELKERLIINHIVTLTNVFGPAAAVDMLLFKTDKEHYPILKTFLVWLNLLSPEKEMELSGIQLEDKAINKLRKIYG